MPLPRWQGPGDDREATVDEPLQLVTQRIRLFSPVGAQLIRGYDKQVQRDEVSIAPWGRTLRLSRMLGKGGEVLLQPSGTLSVPAQVADSDEFG